MFKDFEFLKFSLKLDYADFPVAFEGSNFRETHLKSQNSRTN